MPATIVAANPAPHRQVPIDPLNFQLEAAE